MGESLKELTSLASDLSRLSMEITRSQQQVFEASGHIVSLTAAIHEYNKRNDLPGVFETMTILSENVVQVVATLREVGDVGSTNALQLSRVASTFQTAAERFEKAVRQNGR